MKEKYSLTKDYVAILDDIEKWRKVATDNLVYYGCSNIIYFENKKDILRAYESNETKPDITLLDINLNPQDTQNKEGLEVCQFFKETSPETTIVVMSSLEDIAKEAAKKGADFFIQKKNFTQDFDTFIKQYTEKL